MSDKDRALAEAFKNAGIENPAVLAAVAAVSRVEFVPSDVKSFAYADKALPIAFGQTISQPFLVAEMTEFVLQGKLHLRRVLEVGTGSGYQAAILSHLADEVYTIERIKALYEEAGARLKRLDYKNITTIFGDGYLGYVAAAPFDAIIVTAAAPEIPEALLQQLGEGGCLIIPVGEAYRWQSLQLIRRQGSRFITQTLEPVAFVPMLRGISKKEND
ncbi:MAG: protein-L-isoaspartate O-methyltransferase [Coxiella sp. RIFCSPHIGHO2_12_FULL_42_15]|nr:MAG: protein-L-isoaspartate O-methyltransferase [Coxiella sp. RIFCSPHIGHO2_12_FULL_42_15]